MELGIKLLKFFRQNFQAVLACSKRWVLFILFLLPTGGVNANNVKDYLALPRVVACGGTWMVPSDLVDNQKWEEIGALAKEAMAAL